MPAHHKIDYVEFSACDIPASKAFFSRVFGWTFEDFGSDYTAFANAGIEAFARAASLDLAPTRVCSVSPVFVKETMEKLGMDSGEGLSAADTAKAYLAAVEGEMTGVLDVRDWA